jgi:dihydrodipicolinate synthase/N-acetylneuraminate lyase
VVIRGALAAALTPLRERGTALDVDAVAGYMDFLAAAGLDGVLALGTTGEGILLAREERMRIAELYAAGPLPAIVHCGAQTTADTEALAAHAASVGAAGVAVIGPPYFVLDEAAQLEHFRRAAQACAPLPFYVYEFERASGYAVPPHVVARLAEAAPNLAGLKISDSPFDRVEPYLVEGLDVFIGAEALVDRGMAAGAAGAVSALASAFPEQLVAAVREPTPERAARLGELRAAIERFPRHAALKAVVGRRGVAVREDVRAPLRLLEADERAKLFEAVEPWLASS